MGIPKYTSFFALAIYLILPEVCCADSDSHLSNGLDKLISNSWYRHEGLYPIREYTFTDFDTRHTNVPSELFFSKPYRYDFKLKIREDEAEIIEFLIYHGFKSAAFIKDLEIQSFKN